MQCTLAQEVRVDWDAKYTIAESSLQEMSALGFDRPITTRQSALHPPFLSGEGMLSTDLYS